MTTVPDTERQVPVDDLERARTAEESGGGKRTYTRDPEGTSTGGQFTADPGGSKTTPKPPTKTTPKAKSSQDYKPIVPVKAKTGPMKLGGDNDPQQVKQLQALLGALGLGTPPTNGSFDGATEEAVKEAQRRLGLKPTGRASTALLNKLTSAYALSPCIKRSADEEHDFELFRAAVHAGDFDDPEEDSDDKEMTTPMSLEWGYSLLRSYALEDIEIQRGGDGRTVTAYAAMFGQPYEVRDQHGHYMEEIERSAFNRTLSHGAVLRSAVCLYNHGFTAGGAPDMLGSVPLGTPVEIRAEPKGLLTVTRYNKTALADSVLEAIRNGDIRSQSFRGRIHRSSPERVPKIRSGQPLPTVVRHELGLSDYGPTPFAVNAAAEIVAVRSTTEIQAALDHLDDDVRDEVLRKYVPTPPEDLEDDVATPDPGPGAEDSPAMALRSAADIARRIRVEQILRGM
jgi:HK97 family phage prohead protease